MLTENLLLFVAVVGLHGASGLDMAREDAMSWERKVIAARRALKSGHVEVVVVSEESRMPGETFRENLSIWFKGSSTRVDLLTAPYATDLKKGRARRSRMQRVRTRDYEISNYPPVDAKGKRILPCLTHRLSGISAGIYNIRALGAYISYFGHLQSGKLTDVLARPDRSRSRVFLDVPFGKMKTVRVEYDRSDGAKFRFWISPEQGYNIVKADLSSTEGGKHAVNEIKCDLQKYAEGDVWFPAKVVFTLTINGKLIDKDTITVLEATFNNEIDDRQFWFDTLDVPKGMIVMESPSPKTGSRVWNGKKLVTVKWKQPGDADATAAEDRGIFGGRWILAVILGFAGIACVAIYFLVSKRSGSAGSGIRD